MTYEENVRKYEAMIAILQKQIEKVGPLKRRDLQKHLKKLQRELALYKKYFSKGGKTY